MEEIKIKSYKKKKINSFYLAIWFLVFTIVLTWWLYFYNLSIINNNNDLSNDIKEKENSINTLKQDKEIIAYSLYKANKSSIEKLEDYSRLSLYINHLRKLSRKYHIYFKWFKFSNWNLTTQAIASSDEYDINYKKVSKFIKEYRENKDLSALFDLNLVKTVVAKNDRVDDVFDLNFDLKNNISSILKKSLEKKKKLEEIARKKEKAKQKELREKLKRLKEKAKQKALSNSWTTN